MKKPIPWWFLGLIALLVIWLTGGREIAQHFIPSTPPPSQAAAPTPTPIYQPAPADPEQNSPNKDFFNYVKTVVPTEQRERVKLADLFSLDQVKMNQYFNLAVNYQANTEIVVVSASRARAAQMYSAVVIQPGWFSNLFKLAGDPIGGTELSTITAGDMFLVIGTTPGHILNGIADIGVDGNIITITSEIPMEALYLGLSVAEDSNNPQLESKTVKSPTGLAMMLFNNSIPPESDLTNAGTKYVAKEATWLFLHNDADILWNQFKTAIETPGTETNDLLVGYIQKAFCSKLDISQNLLEQEGIKLDRIACEQLTFDIKLIAKMPTSPSGEEAVFYMKMARSGTYVQTPDPTFTVIP